MFKKALLIVFFLVWVALAINPVDHGVWALENFLVITLLPLVLWLDHRYTFNNLTYLSLVLFVILHLFGAHMTYNTMAYFNWFSECFGWERNYYDQVIHFLFGLMVFAVFFEIFYHQGISRSLSYLLAFLFITAVGAWYEILEWLTMALFCQQPAGACSEAITQGDVWDAQKDIAYAIIGSLIALLIHSLWASKRREKRSAD